MISITNKKGVAKAPLSSASMDVGRMIQNSEVHMSALDQELQSTLQQTELAQQEYAKLSEEIQSTQDTLIKSQIQLSKVSAECSRLKLTITTKQATHEELASQLSDFQAAVKLLENKASQQQLAFLKQMEEVAAELQELRSTANLPARA